MDKVDLSVEFAGVRFKNPILAAAGTPTHTLVNLKNCIAAGVGGIEMKSMSLDVEMQGRPRPANWFLDKYGEPRVLMTIEMAYLTPEEAIKNIKEIKPLAIKTDTRIIANIMTGKWSINNPKDVLDLAKRAEEAGADMLAATTGCPFEIPPEKRESNIIEQIRFLIQTLKGQINIPFYIKSTGYSHDVFFLQQLKAIEDEGEGKVPIHGGQSIPATSIDIESGKPLLSYANIYGRHRAPIENYASWFTYTQSKLQYMSSGGLWTAKDVIERLMCGATLTGVCASAMYKGYAVYKEMIDGLESFFERKNYKSVKDITGVATPYIHDLGAYIEFLVKRVAPKDVVKITVDPEKCNGCGECTMCLDSAVRIENGIAMIDLELCQRCGLCASICPTDAITIVNPNVG